MLIKEYFVLLVSQEAISSSSTIVLLVHMFKTWPFLLVERIVVQLAQFVSLPPLYDVIVVPIYISQTYL